MIGYIILGLVGIYLHLQTKPDKGEGMLAYIKKERRSVISSVLAYGVVVFLWYDVGLEIIGMAAGKLNALTFFIGYSAQSLLGHLIKQFEKKFSKAKLGGT